MEAFEVDRMEHVGKVIEVVFFRPVVIVGFTSNNTFAVLATIFSFPEHLVAFPCLFITEEFLVAVGAIFS